MSFSLCSFLTLTLTFFDYYGTDPVFCQQENQEKSKMPSKKLTAPEGSLAV
jgi:hypothetical protein